MDGDVEEAAKLDITPSEHEPFTIFHEGTANTFFFKNSTDAPVHMFGWFTPHAVRYMAQNVRGHPNNTGHLGFLQDLITWLQGFAPIQPQEHE